MLPSSRRLLPRLSHSISPSTTTTTSHAARSFSCSPSQWNTSKAPALSDISPDSAHTFDAKQKHFRENLAEANRLRKEKERQSAAALSAAKSSSSSSSSNNASIVGDTLGSLTSATGEAARQQDGNDPNKKKPGSGRLSTLIYGTEEGREMDREIERSFSQVLARGKYVHSIVMHEVKPDKVDEYVKLVGGWYPKVAKDPENHVNLVGSWRTEVGECDTFGTSSSRVMFEGEGAWI
jgi:hypothetical protein